MQKTPPPPTLTLTVDTTADQIRAAIRAGVTLVATAATPRNVQRLAFAIWTKHNAK